jgi:hypothetical protein
VAAVGLQTIPTRCSASLLCASPSPQTDNLSQCRLNPFDLICHFELSDHASVTCLSICLGIPVLHARILRTQPAYSTIDQWADFLLNDSAHAFRSRHASQDKLAYILAQANLASSAGVYSSAAQSAGPRAEADLDTICRGDIVTFVGGLCSRSASDQFSSHTLLVTDVILTYPFDRNHTFKSDSLGAAKRLQNHLYRSDYLDQGIAFANNQFLWSTWS